MILTMKKGGIVVRQGDTKDRNLYIIHKGAFVVQRVSGDTVINCGTLHEGDIFGEMSMILGLSRSSTIMATTDEAEVESLSKQAFLDLIQKQPEIAWKVLTNLALKTQRLDEVQSQLNDPESLKMILAAKAMHN